MKRRKGKTLALWIPAALFISVAGFYFYHSRSNTVSLELIVKAGCENSEARRLRLHIASWAQRYDHLASDGSHRSSIVTDFDTGESWSLDHRLKKAVLLQHPSQIRSPETGEKERTWKLTSRTETTCLTDRRCDELKFEGEQESLVLRTLEPRSSESVWLESQVRDLKGTPELGDLLEKFAPGQVLVGLERSRNCESSTVARVTTESPRKDLFTVPSEYQKNFYTDLQHLPAGVREGILKSQGVQILEASPKNPIAAEPEGKEKAL